MVPVTFRSSFRQGTTKLTSTGSFAASSVDGMPISRTINDPLAFPPALPPSGRREPRGAMTPLQVRDLAPLTFSMNRSRWRIAGSRFRRRYARSDQKGACHVAYARSAGRLATGVWFAQVGRRLDGRDPNVDYVDFRIFKQYGGRGIAMSP